MTNISFIFHTEVNFNENVMSFEQQKLVSELALIESF